MVYIDVRDRKFLGIFVIPLVVWVLFLVLAMVDGSAEPELIGVLAAGVAVLLFVIYVAVQFVLERVASSE